MSDRLEQFESELAAMKPRAACPQWSQEIEAALNVQRSSDRRLIAAMALGAMAACVMVAMLMNPSSASTSPSPTVAVARQVPRAGDDIQAFAAAGEIEPWK